MRYYETVYIVNPNFEQSRVDSILKEIEQHLGEFSKVISHNMWGKKKLAYQIDGQKYGTFVLLYFETESSSRISDFESFMKLNSSVLRAQTIRLKTKPSANSLEKNISIDLGDESDGVIAKKESEEMNDVKGAVEQATNDKDHLEDVPEEKDTSDDSEDVHEEKDTSDDSEDVSEEKDTSDDSEDVPEGKDAADNSEANNK